MEVGWGEGIVPESLRAWRVGRMPSGGNCLFLKASSASEQNDKSCALVILVSVCFQSTTAQVKSVGTVTTLPEKA